MLDKLLLFGATGDLAGRFLLPALAELQADRAIPDTFRVVGTATQPLSDEEFRLHAAKRLADFAKDVPETARESLLARLRYCPVKLGVDDVTGALQALLGGSSDGADDARRPIAAYLAVPPRLFVAAVTALGEVGLPAGSRIVVEKPFGESLEHARALNRLLIEVTSRSRDSAVFRVDHVLGMATVHNLLGLRLATASSSRCGTGFTSRASTSCGRRRLRSRVAPATTTGRVRSRTCCRTTCSKS